MIMQSMGTVTLQSVPPSAPPYGCLPLIVAVGVTAHFFCCWKHRTWKLLPIYVGRRTLSPVAYRVRMERCASPVFSTLRAATDETWKHSFLTVVGPTPHTSPTYRRDYVLRVASEGTPPPLSDACKTLTYSVAEDECEKDAFVQYSISTGR